MTTTTTNATTNATTTTNPAHACDYRRCIGCGNWHHEEEMDTDAGGRCLCRDCRGEYIECRNCGEWGHADLSTWIDSEYDEYPICDHCYTYYYNSCASCECVCHEDDMHDTEDGAVCPSCFEELYVRCDDCGHYFHHEHVHCMDEDTYCDRCYDAHTEELQLESYGYKPSPYFFKTASDTEKPLFFGVELEYSHDSFPDASENLEAARHYLNEQVNNFYFKEDSSLTQGFEAVSHPRTLQSWNDQQDNIRRFFDTASHLSTLDDGLHIHVSRKGMSDPHMARLEIFAAVCQDQWQIIARRPSCHWAQYHRKPESGEEIKNMYSPYNSRYRALNWRNNATVEFRIFRTTADTQEFYAALEFCHAAYTWTKNSVFMLQLLNHENPWSLFLDFLHAHKSTYSNLIAFLNSAYTNNEETDISYLHILRKGLHPFAARKEQNKRNGKASK